MHHSRRRHRFVWGRMKGKGSDALWRWGDGGIWKTGGEMDFLLCKFIVVELRHTYAVVTWTSTVQVCWICGVVRVRHCVLQKFKCLEFLLCLDGWNCLTFHTQFWYFFPAMLCCGSLQVSTVVALVRAWQEARRHCANNRCALQGRRQFHNWANSTAWFSFRRQKYHTQLPRARNYRFTVLCAIVYIHLPSLRVEQ